MPGVILLGRVAAAWKAWRGATVGNLDAKFLLPLRPGEEATITLRGEGARVRLEVLGPDGRTLARGTLAAAEMRA